MAISVQDRLDEVFDVDIEYDVQAYGFGVLQGVEGIRQAALALGAGNPVGHHVTNVAVRELDDDSAQVLSKGIGMLADGTAGSVTYDDVVRRGSRVTPRQCPDRPDILRDKRVRPRCR